MFRQIVLHLAEDCAVWFTFEGKKGRVEAAREAMVRSIVDENRLEDGLGDIDMAARTCCIIIALRKRSGQPCPLPFS